MKLKTGSNFMKPLWCRWPSWLWVSWRLDWVNSSIWSLNVRVGLLLLMLLQVIWHALGISRQEVKRQLPWSLLGYYSWWQKWRKRKMWSTCHPGCKAFMFEHVYGCQQGNDIVNTQLYTELMRIHIHIIVHIYRNECVPICTQCW